ncbi:MAG: hypothetical protein ACRELB_26910 [Polyangiaceae bacterium]
MDRNELVTRLVVGTVLSVEERRTLGASVTRAEVGAVIAMLLHRHGRFPLDGEHPGGLQLLVAPTGVRVLVRTRTTAHEEPVTTLEAAVSRYIDRELGPSCQGIRIRP